LNTREKGMNACADASVRTMWYNEHEVKGKKPQGTNKGVEQLILRE